MHFFFGIGEKFSCKLFLVFVVVLTLSFSNFSLFSVLYFSFNKKKVETVDIQLYRAIKRDCGQWPVIYLAPFIGYSFGHFSFISSDA